MGWAITVLTLGLVAGGFWWLIDNGYSLYLIVWLAVVVLALIVLCLMSLPTRIVVTDTEVELRCLVESTYIPTESIADVKQLKSSGLRGKLPLVGSFGFLGYLGRYLELRTGRVSRVYVASRHKCVAIHTSKRRYLVSCNNAPLLVMAINEARKRAAKE